MRRTRIAAAASLLLLAACSLTEADDPGRFEVTFTFAGDAPDPDTQALWLRGRVEERVNDAPSGPVLSEDGPHAFARGVSLNFSGVPNGDDRVVIVELREGEALTAPIAWVGVSQPFDLRAGQTTVVDVSLDATPLLRGEARIAHDRLYETGSSRRVPESAVGIAIEAAFTDIVRVANDPAFSGEVARIEVAQMGAADDTGTVRWTQPWNLNAGICEGALCRDGERTVYIELESTLGYTRTLPPLSATLDTRPPVVSVRFDRPRYRSGETIDITIDSDEALAGFSLALTGPEGEVPLGEVEDRGLSYRYQVDVDALAGDGELRLTGEVADTVGWTTPVQPQPSSIFADTTAPSIAVPMLSRDVIGAGQSVDLVLMPSEALDVIATQLSFDELPLSFVGENTWRLSTSADLSEGGGLRHLQGRLVDLAGNDAPLGHSMTLRIDDVAPRLVGAPRFDRCDGRELARVADNDLWLNTVRCDETPSLTIEFTLSEAPPEEHPPQVSVAGFAFTLLTGAVPPPRFRAAYTPTGDEPQSRPDAPAGQPVVATVRDAAGNTATLRLGTLRFDFEAPASPPVTSAGRIEHLRAPWGDSQNASPHFSISVEAGTLAPGDELLVLDGESADTALVLGRGTVGADGGVDALPLTPVDRKVAWLLLTDAAGNTSDASSAPGVQAVDVKDVRWIATLGGKLDGDRVSNPHRLLAGAAPSPEVFESVATEATGAAALAQLDGQSHLTRATPHWRQLPHTMPTGRRHHATAWDSERGYLVVFGGRCDAGELCAPDTWEWDRNRWRVRQTSATGPSPRQKHAMAFDPLRGVTLLHGGECDAGLCEGTWTWDGGGWARVNASEAEPSPRHSHAMVWDAERERIVLFGGACAEGVCGDTWEWDGNGWRERQLSPRPPARVGAAMAFDAQRGVTLLHGGCPEAIRDGRCADPFDDFWQFDGTSWAQLNPQPAPTADAAHHMAWDSTRNEVVYIASTGAIWRWNGVRWSVELDVAPIEFAREGATLTSMPDGAVLALGATSSNLCGENCQDAWRFNDGGFEHAFSPGPSAREAASMVYESTRDQFLLVAGQDGQRAFGETWVLRDESWSLQIVSGPPPRAFRPELVHDPHRGTTVSFGGGYELRLSSEVFEFDGRRWTHFTPNDGPPHRLLPAMAYDPIAQHMLIFGGCPPGDTLECTEPYGDTWSWNGREFRRLWPEHSPPRRAAATMYQDPVRGGLTLDGGLGAPGDTACAAELGLSICEEPWFWNGEDWSQQPLPSSGPTWRRFALGAADPARGAAMLFGGSGLGGGACGALPACQDLWIWSDSGWTQVEAVGRPSSLAFRAGAYDPRRDRAVLTGGVDEAGTVCGNGLRTQCAESWALERATLRPFAAFDVDAAGALRPSAEDPAQRELLGVDTRVVARGRGEGGDRWLRAASGAGMPIPDADGEGVALPLRLNGSCTVGSLELTVDIDHPAADQLEVALRSPAGDRALIRPRGAPWRDGLRTTYPHISLPAEDLDQAFGGTSAAGVWLLEVSDAVQTARGSIDHVLLDARCEEVARPSGELRLWARARGFGEHQLLAGRTVAADEEIDFALSFDPDFAPASGAGIARWFSEDRLELLIAPQAPSGYDTPGELRIDYWEVTLRYRRQ